MERSRCHSVEKISSERDEVECNGNMPLGVIFAQVEEGKCTKDTKVSNEVGNVEEDVGAGNFFGSHGKKG